MKNLKPKGRICPACGAFKMYSCYPAGEKVCIPCKRVAKPDMHPIYTKKW